jgi:alkanesulfonate monooxygenase SsuD/methylene tetrahydromethanopterin reductase-like flavin-dependent oxidoreductase (luciferase family)
MPGPLGWTYRELQAAWLAADDCGFNVVGCFDHVTAAPHGRLAWDAPTLLTAMAAHTSRAHLAVWVVNVGLRNPLMLAGQLAVAQAESGGRLEVGLGAGSYSLARFDHSALALPFPPLSLRMARVAACCPALRALWRGETVTDASLGLVEASLGPLEIAVPPLTIGGSGPTAMRVAVRHGDLWNAEEADPERFGELTSQLRELAAAERRSTALPTTVQVFADGLTEAAARDLVDRYAAAGAHTLMFILDEERGVQRVAQLATALT